MAWYKCFSGSSHHIPSPWAWEIHNVDLSEDDPNDGYGTGMERCSFLLNVDTTKSAYANNNSIIGATLDDNPLPEPTPDDPYKPNTAMNCSIQVVINSYQIIVFIRGRCYFSDSDPEQQAVGEITGASRTIVGDFRNMDIYGSIGGGTASISVGGQTIEVTTKGVPIEWEEGHEGDWRYITGYVVPKTNNRITIGYWYGGAGYHEFDGHINYLKIG